MIKSHALRSILLAGLSMLIPFSARAFITESASGALEILLTEGGGYTVTNLVTGQVTTSVWASPEIIAALSADEAAAAAEIAALEGTTGAAGTAGVGFFGTVLGAAAVMAEAGVAIYLANDLNNTITELSENPDVYESNIVTVSDWNQMYNLGSSDYWNNFYNYYASVMGY